MSSAEKWFEEFFCLKIYPKNFFWQIFTFWFQINSILKLFFTWKFLFPLSWFLNFPQNIFLKIFLFSFKSSPLKQRNRWNETENSNHVSSSFISSCDVGYVSIIDVIDQGGDRQLISFLRFFKHFELQFWNFNCFLRTSSEMMGFVLQKLFYCNLSAALNTVWSAWT